MPPFLLYVLPLVSAAVPTVILGNSRGTAVPGLEMPAIGLGTGAYSNNAAVGYGGCGFWAPPVIEPARALN
jgi:hypothetical protein